MRLTDLKQQWQKVIVLFLMLVGQNLTAYTQTSSIESDSLKCFTIDEAKTLLMYANRGIFADSLMGSYEKKIEIFESIVSIKDEELLLSQRLIEAQMMEIARKNKNIKWLKVSLIGVSLVAVLELIKIITP